MEVHIFDVDHGSCNVIVTPSREVIVIDCGHNSTTGWRPSEWLAMNFPFVTNLTFTNMDEDHVSDLPNMRRRCTILSLSRNWHLTADFVREAKFEQGMGSGVDAAVSMIETYAGPPPETAWGGVLIDRFCHPPTLFSDENSLSLVTFIQFGAIQAIFPGDLTRQGWQAFLGNERFRQRLGRTNIFVASHHGREDGYCPEVFRWCHPEIIVISDKSVMHDTQVVGYSDYASGVRFTDGNVRKVLSTRKNGKITITDQNPPHPAWVTITRC